MLYAVSDTVVETGPDLHGVQLFDETSQTVEPDQDDAHD